MMMGTSTIADIPATLSTLSDMVQLMSDPVAAKARVAEMAAATTALQQATEESRVQQASFVVAEADHRANLEKQAADAAASLSAAELAFEKECAHRKQVLDDREANLAILQAQAASDAKDAATAKAIYDGKLAIIKSAM